MKCSVKAVHCVGVQPESVPIIKEEVFGLHVSEVQFGVFTSKDDLIPQHHLVQRLKHTHIYVFVK